MSSTQIKSIYDVYYVGVLTGKHNARSEILLNVFYILLDFIFVMDWLCPKLPALLWIRYIINILFVTLKWPKK